MYWCCAECVGYKVDSLNYATSLIVMASSNSPTAPDAIVRADADDSSSVWTASTQDVDADGDYIYSVMLLSSQDSYIATLRMDVSNVAVIMLYVQCRERPGSWSSAITPVCNSQDTCVTFTVASALELQQFSAERCNCIASSAIAIRCRLSVVICLSSVTRMYCDNTAEDRIIQFSLKCSPMPYLFACQV